MFFAIVFALGTPACLDDPNGLGTDESPLVGGTSTSLRPEIGQFFNGAGSVCTATLIAPRVVITAAHCLSPQYTGTVPAGGAMFQIGAGNFTVDRIVSFATKRFEYAPGNLGTTDVALLHLAAPVPSSVVPAALSLNPPALDARSSVFGFGCTDRNGGGTGGGGKQVFSFDAGNITTALCWGDSGGPDVFGNPGDNGALWGVNSDFNFLPWVFPANWTDVFATTAFYKHQIESAMRQFDGPLEVGMNRPGMDYAVDSDPTAAACATRCTNDAGCRAFTWIASGACFRKFAVPDVVPAAGGTATSGLAPVLEVATNRNGMDYNHLPSPGAESCASTCAVDSGCHAWTFTSDGTCWLKNGVPAASACSNCTSGVFDRSFEPNTDRNGGDLRSISVGVGSTKECAKACAQDSACMAFTLIGGSTNNCFLKGSPRAPSFSPGATSGLKKGVQAQTNRGGSDIANFDTPVLSPYICQAACANNARCQAWTYTLPPPTGTQGHCWLKDRIPGPSPDNGSVSGVRGLEFVP